MIVEKKKNTSILKSVLIAHLVLTFHVLLVAILGIVILFFRSIIYYRFWLLVGVIVLSSLFILYFYKKIKLGTMVLKNISSTSKVVGYPLEVSFFRGLVSIKTGQFFLKHLNSVSSTDDLFGSEVCSSSRTNEITELVGLLERKLITVEEYNRVKKDILM